MTDTATTTEMELYEGLFLFSLQETEGDTNAALEALKSILDRAEAEIVTLSKWDERKLAYEIKGQRRGLYLLTHFRARGSQIANIERDVNLSEMLLRCLIIKGDHIGETEMDTFKEAAAKSADEVALRAAAAEDTDPAPAEAPAAEAPAADPAPAEAPAEADTDSEDK